MTKAEEKFKEAVLTLIDSGVYPSPKNIGKVLESGRIESKQNLSGKECRWRREACSSRGFVLNGSYLVSQAIEEF